MSQIAESASILGTSIFWLLLRANPAGLGAKVGALPASLVLGNLIIQMAGEWVVSDSIIAYISNHYTKRYIINLPQAWKLMRSKRRFIFLIIFFGAFMCWNASYNVATSMCLTSMLGEEEDDWVMGQCPSYPKNIGDMLRVGETYLNGTLH